MMFTLNFMKTHQMFKKSLGGTDKWIWSLSCFIK
jgi:hypothetical protein